MAGPRPDGEPPPPAVQRLRLRYAKRGRLRFASHRDFQRAFERALRRAGVPIAYSAGFSPHPKVSYAGAAPTGTASEAEYLEIGLVRRCEPAWVRDVLDTSLPPGLDVLDAVEVQTPDLAGRLEASVWEMRFADLEEAALRHAADTFLAAREVQVERMTKNGMRRMDARSAVLRLDVSQPAAQRGAAGPDRPCAILQVVVRHGQPAVRPDDILAGLRQMADFAPPSPPWVTRLAQGPFDAQCGAVADPLAPDRGAPVADGEATAELAGGPAGGAVVGASRPVRERT
ncbi:MAG: TIGR03936 family radical SAM-associated protein [Carbonactinosporaceae bacterium]